MLFGIWAAALLVVFVAFRSADLLKLPDLIGNLGGGSLVGGAGLLDSAVGILAAVLIFGGWMGLGTFVARFIPDAKAESGSLWLEIARKAAIGAITWSLIWFFLGLLGLYSGVVAVCVTVLGVVFAVMGTTQLRVARMKSDEKQALSGIDRLLIGGIAFSLLIALIGSLAPPIAKDTLLYHFAVPKAFIAQHGNAFIDGNIASYLALGTEMHVVWAMLLGNFVDPRAGEAAAGTTVFLFFPLLLMVVYGWARQAGISRGFSLLATFMIAAIPTAFHVASSGYIDISLALYIALAVYSLTRWWQSLAKAPLIFAAICLGGALAVKLTTVFVIAGFALVILLRARKTPGSAVKIGLAGFAALVLAGVIASPWYLRNWAATGSPVFPFYLSIWKGTANGWDVERSNLFQAMNSQYGGGDVSTTNYLMSPFRVSLAAQPENPELYDGVLGAAFLIGLPLLIWAIWKKKLADEFVIAAGVAGIVYLFWLFSSPQLRYLLPIAPLVTIGIVAAIESVSTDAGLEAAAKYSLLTASILAMLTSVAWFCQKAPLRVALGGETRDEYLSRNLDYYPYYQTINSETESNSRVWLINMRRDMYNIDRDVFSDYLFEDWTLRKLVWESRSSQELKAKAAAMNVQYVLTRHDFLFDYDRSTLVDDKKPRVENEAKLKIAKDLILDPANTVRADNKFSLIKVF